MTTSMHYQNSRQYREVIINSIGGYGNVICSCEVDRGHKNGAEIHYITDNAIIVITNKNSGKKVTTLIARPMQLKRYGLNIPQEVLDKAYMHELKKLNI